MRRLYKLYVGLASGTDLNAALNEILAAATQLSGTEHGTIQLVSDDDDRIEIAAHQGYSKDSRFIRHFLKAGSELACDRAFHERKRIIIENIETHPDFKGTKDREIALEEGIRAQQSTPMITRKGEAVGVLSTQFRQPHRPDKRELGLINLLAWTAAEFVERHHTDKALRESEERYRNLFESMDEGYCIIQMIFDKDDEPVDYRFLEMNPAFGKLTGLKNAEGKRMREMVPDHEEHWFENYGKVAKTGEPIRFENRAENLPNPSIYDVYAFRFGKPDERKVAILFKDVTEQKKANRKNAHLGAVVNNSDDAIISKDLNTIITSWNNGAENLFGYTEEEAIGEPVTIIMPEETMEETDIFLKRLERGESIDHFETIRRHKDGSILNVSLTISPVRDDNGEIVGASKIARDITEQKRQEKELNELNETLEDRVEKRTSALLSYQKQLRSLGTQLSKAEEKERRRLATSLHDNLGQMLAACKMQMDIIQKTGNLSNMGRASGLLDEAISHTRRLMSDLKPPPLLGKENIDSTLQWIAKKMKRYDLNVVLNSNGPPARLEEDVQIVLAQCTQELLFNVVKHANTNEVWVELSYPDSKIKIMVEDHGEGFDNKAQRELDLSKDSGFGLFNVRERIDMLGGRTDIVSKPGTGTKISLIVPTDDENAEASGRQKPDSGDLQAKQHPYRIKILLVDDHEIMRDGLKKIIEDENDLKVVAEASDGNNIVELARKTKPDVVIMDVNLPGSINGIEATQKIKTELPDIRVVGLSLYDDEKVAQNMRDAGAMAYLTKTEASEALCATIRSVAGAE
jgi:PAS domain S-box-containing protein